MRNGTLLDLIYQDTNMIRLIEKKTGKIVCYIKREGSTRAVYQDKNKMFVAEAVEKPSTRSYPRVDIGDGSVIHPQIGEARISISTFLGEMGDEVEFVTTDAVTIGKSNYKGLRKLYPDADAGTRSGGSTGGSSTGGSGNTGGSRTGGGGTGGGGGTSDGGGTGGHLSAGGSVSGCGPILIFSIICFLIWGLGKLLTGPLAGVYNYAYQILQVVQFLTARYPVLVVVPVFLLVVPRPRGKDTGMVVFYAFLLIFTVLIMQHMRMELDWLVNNYTYMKKVIGEIGFNLEYGIGISAYMVVLLIIRAITKKSANHEYIVKAISRASMVVMVLTFIFVMAVRTAVAYLTKFNPYTTAGYEMVLLCVWYFLCTCLGLFVPLILVSVVTEQ